MSPAVGKVSCSDERPAGRLSRSASRGKSDDGSGWDRDGASATDEERVGQRDHRSSARGSRSRTVETRTKRITEVFWEQANQHLEQMVRQEETALVIWDRSILEKPDGKALGVQGLARL